MHSYCRPLRMSMPVGQTVTHWPQSTQSPSPAAFAVNALLAHAAHFAARRVVGDDQRRGRTSRSGSGRTGTCILHTCSRMKPAKRKVKPP